MLDREYTPQRTARGQPFWHVIIVFFCSRNIHHRFSTLYDVECICYHYALPLVNIPLLFDLWISTKFLIVAYLALDIDSIAFQIHKDNIGITISVTRSLKKRVLVRDFSTGKQKRIRSVGKQTNFVVYARHKCARILTAYQLGDVTANSPIVCSWEVL